MRIIELVWSLAARLARYLLTTAGVLVGIAVLAVLVSALKIAFYEQQDDTVHLRNKQAYLQEIGSLSAVSAGDRPNLVFVLYDDLGYSDFSITGSQAISTPNIDALAREGMMLSQFYSPAPVCTPARFGYLTGRHAERGLPNVVFPERAHPATWMHKLLGANIRIPAHEITLADILRAAGYRTGMVGKWHLGDHSPSLPNDMGFEEYFGALYSNDMQPFALYRNRNIVHAAPADQTRLSEYYADEAVAFIERHRDEPFFLYLAHNFPHIPLHVRDSRKGQSGGGLYGDVVEELDDDIGQLIAGLKAAGVYDNTLVIISSDNGPWFQGSAGDVRGRKGDTFEGGMRVPFIAHWPGKLCAGCTTDGLAMGTDLLPTVLELLQLPAPEDRVLDGKSLLPMLRENAPSPHDYLFYFSGGDLLAVRDQRFKYMPRRGILYGVAGSNFGFGVPQGPWIFDLENDPNESYDASDRLPEDFRRLQQIHESRVREMQRNPAGWQ
jgi:arylsulfatase A-like enzyme